MMSDFKRNVINLLVTIVYECTCYSDIMEAVYLFCDDNGIRIEDMENE